MPPSSNPHATPVPVNLQIPDDAPAPPAEKESLAHLKAAPLTDSVVLTWPALPCQGLLALASAYDMREPCHIRLHNPANGWQADIDAGYASIAQRFHVEIPPGIDNLEISTDNPSQTLWIINDNKRLPDSAPNIWPISDQVDRQSRFFERLAYDCIAEFGWMGGCVIEAFDALATIDNTGNWIDARERWLGNFLDDQHLHYQDLRSRPQTDNFVIVEATLPIASIARTHPDHPIINTTIHYLRTNTENSTTCEGCYTVAYPLIQIGVLTDQPDLIDQAFNELLRRRDKLFCNGDIYLRYRDNNRTFRNWARGVAWYLLGFAKCLDLAGQEGRWADHASHLAERCRWALEFQRDDGLWDNFFDEPGAPPDTSGSAGIAVALVHAHQLGLLGNEASDAAYRCWSGLQSHLLIDGWLAGVAPSNKRGEQEQHGHRRVSETFGMGLMGQLAAVVR